MTEPIYDDFTETFYARRLPEIYRQADASYDWTLKRWLSGILGEYNNVDTLITRFKYVTPDSGGAADDTSDLVDPMTADVLWLPWLAQLVGLIADPDLAEADQRAAILNAVTGTRRGSKAGMASAVRKRLTGSRAVTIFDHTTDVSAVGAAGEWDVAILTVSSETPVSGATLIQDVIDAGQKPAGVKLYHRTYEASWATIEAARAMWNSGTPSSSWDGNSWQTIEETGL